MKEIRIAFPKDAIRSLFEDKQKELSFTTDEHGGPTRVVISIREHNQGDPTQQRLPLRFRRTP